jgi:hypothetical protein
MKNKRHPLPKILGLLALATLALTACSTAVASPEKAVEDTVAAAPVEVETEIEAISDAVASEPENEETAAADAAQLTVSTNGLTDAEIDGLLFMREEEKLAHDVYLTLYEAWELPLFQNIAGSEQTHAEAVLHLLNTYGIDDPAEGNALGEFTNPDLQALYDDLVAWGRQSLADALKVGAAIEEIDILDLQDNLNSLNNTAIEQVYQNLLSGSENHLRAFTQTLARQTGETYTPQYLSPDAYDAIVGNSAQGGAGMGQGGRGGGRRP